MHLSKALHGPRTQAYGETKYKKEISQVLDKTKALHGPRTQAYRETNYKKETLQGVRKNYITCTLGFIRGKLSTNNWVSS